MADLKKSPHPFGAPREDAGSSLLFLRDEQLRQGIELMYFAYRDFTGGPDDILEKYGFGRAHHRVLHFVGAAPGLSVTELLKILRITKQSLSRVLKQLIDQGLIDSMPGRDDRRKRILRLTEKGKGLARELAEIQRMRVFRAFRKAGPEAVAGWRAVLAGLLSDDEADEILSFVNRR